MPTGCGLAQVVRIYCVPQHCPYVLFRNICVLVDQVLRESLNVPIFTLGGFSGGPAMERGLTPAIQLSSRPLFQQA